VVVDGMLVVNTKKENYTFVYDINYPRSQIFYPFELRHRSRNIKAYDGVFVGSRHAMPDGSMSRWGVNICVIFQYVKNEVQIFDFLFERENAKGELMRWLRENLVRIKRENLSKFWKKIFSRSGNLIKESDNSSEITFDEINSEIFEEKNKDEIVSK
jgi:hypothetical protein